MSDQAIALLVLIGCLVTIAIISIRDCESDADYYARAARRRNRAFRRDLERMRWWQR